MLIDTHCHLHFTEFDADREAVIARAREAGVRTLVQVGTDPASNEAALSLARSHPFCFFTAGLHPHHAGAVKDGDLEAMRAWVRRERPCAIGEAGLDYFKSAAPAEIQKKVFAFMVRLAVEEKLPLIVHSRDAFEDTLEVVRAEGQDKLRAVMHCFSYDAGAMRRWVDAGHWVSFTGIVTFKNAGAVLEAARETPLERMMLETDAPYLAPQAFRGKRNEPAFLSETAAFLARERGLDARRLAEQTSQNAIRFFNWAEQNGELGQTT